MNPVINTAKKEIAPGEKGFKNVLQKMFRRGRKTHSEDSSICTSSLSDTICSSNKTTSSTRSSKKKEPLENSRNTKYIEIPKDNNVDVTTNTTEEVKSRSSSFPAVDNDKALLNDENTTLNEDITQSNPETRNRIEEPIEYVHEEYVNIRDWHEILEQWEIIDEDIPEIGLEALRWEVEEPTVHEQEIDVNLDNHEDNECLAGLENSVRLEEREVFQNVFPQQGSVNSESWGYQYENYVKMYSRSSRTLKRAIVPERNGEEESSADLKNSSFPVKCRAARIVYPLKYSSILRNRKYHSKFRRIFSIETLQEELGEATGNEEETNIENNGPSMVLKNSSSMDDWESSEDVALNNCLKTCEHQYEDIINTCAERLKKESEEPRDTKPERVFGPDSLEENESLPALEYAGCVKEWGDSETSAAKECSATLDKRISQNGNMCSETMEKESEEPTENEKSRVVNQNSPEECESLPILKIAGSLKELGASEDTSPHNCSVTLEKCELQCENIISTISELLEKESKEPIDTEHERVDRPDSLEENESLYVLEKDSRMNEWEASETEASQTESQCHNSRYTYSEIVEMESEDSEDNEQEKIVNLDNEEKMKRKCFVISVKMRVLEFENIINGFSQTLKYDSKEATGNDKKKVVNPDCLEKNEPSFAKKCGATATLEERESQYENSASSGSETLANKSKEPANNEKERFVNPDSLEENRYSPVLENAGCLKEWRASETSASQRCATTLEKKESQYDNINIRYTYSETVEMESEESTDNEQERIVNPDNPEEDESVLFLENAPQYDNIRYTYSEIVEMESEECTDNEQERIMNPDNIKETLPKVFLENTGYKKTMNFSEAVALHMCSVNLETCQYGNINTVSKTLKKESKEPTSDNEEKRVVNPESLEEINSNDFGNVSFRVERQDSNRDESFLRQQIIFFLLYLMALIFIFWLKNNSTIL